MDKEALFVMVVTVSLVPVYGQQREQRYQLQGLPQHIGQCIVISVIIIGIHGQNASGQCVHHIVTGSLHNDIPHKVCRQ